MICPKCKFEQPASDACTNCGIIFLRYKEAQERKKEVDHPPLSSNTPTPPYNSGDDLKLLTVFMFSVIAWAIVTESVECFAGRNQTCHEIYNSVADPGEFWVTILVMYIVSLFSISMGVIGIQQRCQME